MFFVDLICRIINTFKKYFFSFIGSEAVQKDKRQNLIPSARIGREIFLTDEDFPIEYPNLEESIEFSGSVPDYFDSDVFTGGESDNEDIEDDFSSKSVVERKKRSLSETQSDKSENQKSSGEIKSNWNKETKSNFYKIEKRRPRKNLIFIPRIGKKSFEDEMSYVNKRVVFIPRIGKKNFGDIDFSEDKRAVFIPRIGKRSYITPDAPNEKRAVFIPRIGRGTAILPQIVRPNPRNRVNGRVVFIPRIG